jgi:sugar O-acyltransferase (sialic acid O-acetyltransferase NeuD family)
VVVRQNLEDKGDFVMNVIIVGAGGQGRVIADAIQCSFRNNGRLTLGGFLDDNLGLQSKESTRPRILGRIADIHGVPHDAVVVGIGDNATRRKLFVDLEAQGENIISIVHPDAVVAEDVLIGKGTVIFAGVVVNAGSCIGSDVILNTGCTVDHNAKIDSHVHICPGVHLAGGVTVGEGAFVGIGGAVIQNRTIGAWAIVGAGAVVIRDVMPRTTVVGVPARILSDHPRTTTQDNRDLVREQQH